VTARSATDVDTGVNTVTTRLLLEGTLFSRVMLSSNHDPGHAIAAVEAMTVARLYWCIAAGLTQHDSKITVTARATAVRYLAISGSRVAKISGIDQWPK
jgi:hypothetical protein